MNSLAHSGTSAILCRVLLLGAAACQSDGRSTDAGQDSRSDGSVPTSADSAAALQCSKNQDCVVIPVGACAACQPSLDDVQAVRADAVPSPGPACGPCPEPDWWWIDPQFRAVCVANECKVLD